MILAKNTPALGTQQLRKYEGTNYFLNIGKLALNFELELAFYASRPRPALSWPCPKASLPGALTLSGIGKSAGDALLFQNLPLTG